MTTSPPSPPAARASNSVNDEIPALPYFQRKDYFGFRSNLSHSPYRYHTPASSLAFAASSGPSVLSSPRLHHDNQDPCYRFISNPRLDIMSTDATNGESSSKADVIYTPASTISTEHGEADENREGAPWDASGWSNYKAERLLQELKDMMEKLKAEDDASSVTRLKANHRSSLASLAENHRTEIAGLKASHQEELRRAERQHMDEMRAARREFGHDRELVRGLHESYGKQIESLVLDLSQARWEIRELKLKSVPNTVSDPESTPRPSNCSLNAVAEEKVEEQLNASLQVHLEFDGLGPFSFATLSVPHPGNSFGSLWKVLCSTVKNHLTTLESATSFLSTAESVLIRQWYEAAQEERLYFRFMPQEDTALANTNMTEMWEGSLCKDASFELHVLCATEPWDNIPVYGVRDEVVPGDELHDRVPETDDETIETNELIQATADSLNQINKQQPLVNVVGSFATEKILDTTTAYQQISEDLGQLQVSDNSQTSQCADHSLEAYSEERSKPELIQPTGRRVTVEEVRDIDDPLRASLPLPEDVMGACARDVGVAVSTMRPDVPDSVRSKPNPIDIWQQDVATQTNPAGSQRSAEIRNYFDRIMEENRRENAATGPRSSDSWAFDDIFPSTSPVEKAKEKPVTVFVSNDGALEDNQKAATKQGLVTYLMEHGEEQLPGATEKGKMWTWPHEKEAVDEPEQESCKDHENTHQIRESSQEDIRLRIQEHRDIFRTSKDVANDRPFFTFTDAQPASPAPPPAPSAPMKNGRDSPTIPIYIHPDAEIQANKRLTPEAVEFESGSHITMENPFADLHLHPATCDTPIIDTSRSVVSTTPLLDDDVTGRKSLVSPPPAVMTDATSDTERRHAAPSFEPLSGEPSQQGSPRPSSRYHGYGFQNFENEEESQQDVEEEHWDAGSEASATTVEFETRSVHGQRCGRGDGSEAYTWRRDLRNSREANFRARSASPAPSQPSQSSDDTATDRNSEFVLPPLVYQPNPATSVNSVVSNPFITNVPLVGNIPMNMGPRHYNSFPVDMHTRALQVQQMQQKQMEDYQNYMQTLAQIPPRAMGSNRSSAEGSSFGHGGPVFAPNPPNSLSMGAVSNGHGSMPIMANMANFTPNNAPNAVFPPTPSSTASHHMSASMSGYGLNGMHHPTFANGVHSSIPQHVVSRNWNRPGSIEPHRTYSNESISPLLGMRQTDGVQQSMPQGLPQGMPMQMMGSQSSHTTPNGMPEQQMDIQPGMVNSGLMNPWGNQMFIGQQSLHSGSPGSQHSGVGVPRAPGPVPWFPQPQYNVQMNPGQTLLSPRQSWTNGF